MWVLAADSDPGQSFGVLRVRSLLSGWMEFHLTKVEFFPSLKILNTSIVPFWTRSWPHDVVSFRLPSNIRFWL